MTNYYVEALQTDPFVKIFKVDQSGSGAGEMGIRPAMAATPLSVRFSPARDKLALVYDFRVDESESIGSPSSALSTQGAVIFSPNGTWMFSLGNAGSPAAMYRKAGPTYVLANSVSSDIISRGVYISAAFAKDDQLAVVQADDRQAVRIYNNYGGDFIQIKEILIDSTVLNVKYSPSNSYIIINTMAGTNILQKSDFTEVVAGTETVIAVSDDDRRFITNRPRAGGLISVLKILDGQFVSVGELPNSNPVGTAGVSVVVNFTNGGQVIILQSHQNGTVYRNNVSFYAVYNDQYIKTHSSDYSTSQHLGPMGSVLSADSKKYIVGFNKLSGGVPTFSDVHFFETTMVSANVDGVDVELETLALTGSGYVSRGSESNRPTYRIVSISPDGSIVHFTKVNSSSQHYHLKTTSPFGQATSLPFAPELRSVDVRVIAYSPAGDVVIWSTSTDTNVAIASSDGAYRDASSLTGTFVSVYELQGDVFTEVDYAMHEIGTRISNMVFSQSASAFSYFAINPDNPASTTQGRFVYRVSDHLNLTGVEWEPGMTRSLLAFHPLETHFAATYERSGNPNEIRLYKVLNGSYAFDRTDADDVAFGPVDISSCNDVLVAHGGEPPFTWYKIADDLLVEQPIDIDWNEHGFIVNLKFLDCDTIVVITKDEVVLIENGEETDAVPKEEEGESIDVLPGNIIRIPPPDGIGGGGESFGNGGGGNGNGGGGWDITPTTYIPYTAISVFYRD